MPKAPSFALNALQQPACPCPSAHMPPPHPLAVPQTAAARCLPVRHRGVVLQCGARPPRPSPTFSRPTRQPRRPKLFHATAVALWTPAPGGGGGLPPAFQSCGPDTWTAPRWPRSSPSVRTVRTACCRCWGGPPAYLRAVRQSYGMRLKLSRGFTGFGVADRLGVLTPSTTNVGQVPN